MDGTPTALPTSPWLAFTILLCSGVFVPLAVALINRLLPGPRDRPDTQAEDDFEGDDEMAAEGLRELVDLVGKLRERVAMLESQVHDLRESARELADLREMIYSLSPNAEKRRRPRTIRSTDE